MCGGVRVHTLWSGGPTHPAIRCTNPPIVDRCRVESINWSLDGPDSALFRSINAHRRLRTLPPTPHHTTQRERASSPAHPAFDSRRPHTHPQCDGREGKGRETMRASVSPQPPPLASPHPWGAWNRGWNWEAGWVGAVKRCPCLCVHPRTHPPTQSINPPEIDGINLSKKWPDRSVNQPPKPLSHTYSADGPPREAAHLGGGRQRAPPPPPRLPKSVCVPHLSASI